MLITLNIVLTFTFSTAKWKSQANAGYDVECFKK